MDDDARATARAKVVAIVRQYAPTLVVVLPPARRNYILLTDGRKTTSVDAYWRTIATTLACAVARASSSITSSSIV